MQGKIVKGISGFYYVHVGEPGIYECKAKGAFRNQKIKPLVGDDVEIAIVDEETKKGNLKKSCRGKMNCPPGSCEYRSGADYFCSGKTAAKL